ADLDVPGACERRRPSRVCRLTARPFPAAACAPSALWRVGDRGLHHRAELVTQQEAVEVAHLHHVERDQPLLRVDPEQCAAVAGPAVLARRARQARYPGLAAYLEAQPEAQARGGD